MDTSKTYIKQCACPEIQKQWKPKNWKSYHCWHTRLKTMGDIIYGRDWEHSEGELVWLPRQDQVQDMIPHEDRIHSFLLKFYFFLTNEIGIDVSIFTTAEQLWLAFYMDDQHKKFWDGKKWVKR